MAECDYDDFTPFDMMALRDQEGQSIGFQDLQSFVNEMIDKEPYGPAYRSMKKLVNQYNQSQFADDILENESVLVSDVETIFSKGQGLFIDGYHIEETGDENYDELYDEPSNKRSGKGGGYDQDSMQRKQCIVNIFKTSEMNRIYQDLLLKVNGQRSGFQLKQKRGVAILKNRADIFGGKPFFTGRNSDEDYSDGECADQDIILNTGIILKSTPEYITVLLDCSAAKFRKAANDQFFLAKYNSMIPKERSELLFDMMGRLAGDQNSLSKRIFNYLDRVPDQMTKVLSTGSVLFGPLLKDQSWTAYQQLNDSQKQAVQNSLKCDSFYMIHGPPGTGKSETLVVILEALVRANQRVLICSEANNPVDNLLSKFALTEVFKNSELDSKRLVVRLGNSWLVDPAVRKYTVDALLSRKMHELKQKERASNGRYQVDGPPGPSFKDDILRKSQLVFATQCSVFSKAPLKCFLDNPFDYVVIDEASQSFLSFSFMGIALGRRVIFAGDHLQLPAVIKGSRGELEKSLFERLIESTPNNKDLAKYYTMLNIQYRMHMQLMETSSRLFYGNCLRCGPANEKSLLEDTQADNGDILPNNNPMIWVENPCLEESYARGQFTNAAEATVVLMLIKDLIFNMGVRQEAIGVIVSYNSQRESIANKIFEDRSMRAVRLEVDKLMVSTVDSFQGREKEVIIYASTRANRKNEIGFLADLRRFNVAVTRAKRMLVFIGNSQTLVRQGRNQDGFGVLYNNIKKSGLILDFSPEDRTFTNRQTTQVFRLVNRKKEIAGDLVSIKSHTSYSNMDQSDASDSQSETASDFNLDTRSTMNRKMNRHAGGSRYKDSNSTYGSYQKPAYKQQMNKKQAAGLIRGDNLASPEGSDDESLASSRQPTAQGAMEPLNPFFKGDNQPFKIVQFDPATIKSNGEQTPQRELPRAPQHQPQAPPQPIKPPSVRNLMPPELSVRETISSESSGQLSRVFNTGPDYEYFNQKKSQNPSKDSNQGDYMRRPDSSASDRDDWSVKSISSNSNSNFAAKQTKPTHMPFGKKGSAAKYHPVEDFYDNVPQSRKTREYYAPHAHQKHAPANYDSGSQYQYKQPASAYESSGPKSHHHAHSVKSSKPTSRDKYSYQKKAEPHYTPKPGVTQKKQHQQTDEDIYSRKAYK